MPISLLSQSIQAARASGTSITTEDQPVPYPVPYPAAAPSQQVHFTEAETLNRLERAGNHATSSPIPNSRRFPSTVILTLDDPERPCYGCVRTPSGLCLPQDNMAGYYFERTRGLGREDMRPTRAIDVPRFHQNLSIWQGPFPAKVEEEEFDPNKFYTRPLVRKNVPITGLQWLEHWKNELEFALQAMELDRHIEDLERPQIIEQDHDAEMFRKYTDGWEKGKGGDWVRRDYQAEEDLRLEKEAYDRETEELKRIYEEQEEDRKRREREKADEEEYRAWEEGVKEFQDEFDVLADAFLGKQDMGVAKGGRGSKGVKRSSKQCRVRVYHGAAKGACKGIRACG
ncbi:hypothetical protein P171DRAFT_441735 [Karstenula rhodostoma CBS 690.94]|uniref:Uncharacterized protein n=1 Tax=Karstenula rhodostoma CBS 690.94 TaxID=1392251 RepID=A0A9P4UFT2_9PLEO|nr:hypothetical protein P171DRAFT_441735 [Karstenula rhodostoma CBS 690.94]